MTSLASTANAVSRPSFNRPGTTAYWGSPPSPVSPITRNEKRSGSSRRITRSAGAPAAARQAAQRDLTSPVGSPNQEARTPLRAAHRCLGSSQEIFSAWRGTSRMYSPRTEAPQPAPSAVSREDSDTRAP